MRKKLTVGEGNKLMNNKINKKRQIALSILKPSKKDLEHGLELHRNSIVCDSYGFAPSSAVDGDAICKAIEEGASNIELVDLMEEMNMMQHLVDKTEQKEFKEAWEASGVTCVFQNAGAEGPSPLRLIKRFARFTHVTDMMSNFLNRATVPDDIDLTKKQGRHCFYLSLNGVPLTQQWNSVEEELPYIKIFFQLGCRMMHLTYNRRNMLGDGCAEISNSGLSDFGRAVIHEMNRTGVIVDVAHSGWQTSLESAKVSDRPVVASHSTCLTINKHCRAKPDEVIRTIADTGGYIGICCIPAFLGRNGDINALLDHIEYAVRKFGVDHVAIGTDRGYKSQSSEKEKTKIPKRRRIHPRFENFWPENDPLFDPKWRQEKQRQSLAWTNWPLFTVGLVQRGYSDRDIQKIIGGNVLRVARAVLSEK
ncbi:dipeptidase [bacterium]|nr:dipeptidase [bacterium]